MGAEDESHSETKKRKMQTSVASNSNVRSRLRPKKDQSEKYTEPVKVKRGRETVSSSKENVLIVQNLKSGCLSGNSKNILHYLSRVANGDRVCLQFRQIAKKPLITLASRLKQYQTFTPFERRVTVMTWHPVYTQIVAIGSKFGELSLFNLNQSENKMFCPGVGAGGSVVALKFNLDNPHVVYTASITGKIKQEDFNGQNNKTLLSTLTWQNWFSALDVSYQKKLLLAGDSHGHAYMMTISGEKVWPSTKKMHKGKISHLEFCPKEPNIIASASTDHTVKLWDLRMIAENSSILASTHTFVHDRAVNSASFSPSNSCSLLTTDQYSQIRVYSGPFWNKKLIIPHPHRQFQHITPIKASWHPLEDIFIVGRYPDDSFCKEDQRTIDFYDSNTGNIMHRMFSPDNKISSLNAFNATGENMVSGAGYSVIFWKDINMVNYPSHDKLQKSVTTRRPRSANPRNRQSAEVLDSLKKKTNKISKKKL